MAFFTPVGQFRELCRSLGRCERTVKDWLNERTAIPLWVIAVLRLEVLEHELKLQQMGFKNVKKHLKQPQSSHFSNSPGVNDDVFELPAYQDELDVWSQCDYNELLQSNSPEAYHAYR